MSYFLVYDAVIFRLVRQAWTYMVYTTEIAFECQYGFHGGLACRLSLYLAKSLEARKRSTFHYLTGTGLPTLITFSKFFPQTSRRQLGCSSTPLRGCTTSLTTYPIVCKARC